MKCEPSSIRLVEDGLFEECIPMSVALLAEMLWNPCRSDTDVFTAAQSPYFSRVK